VKTIAAIAGAFLLVAASSTVAQGGNAMKIRFMLDGKELATATLADTAIARDFFSLLPLTLNLQDYASTEKIAYLPRTLATTGAPAGSDPTVGDISYYAPWGNLAIFYKDAPYAKGLLPLGRVDSPLDALRGAPQGKVTVENASK